LNSYAIQTNTSTGALLSTPSTCVWSYTANACVIDKTCIPPCNQTGRTESAIGNCDSTTQAACAKSYNYYSALQKYYYCQWTSSRPSPIFPPLGCNFNTGFAVSCHV
jgi:hypothetical protein